MRFGFFFADNPSTSGSQAEQEPPPYQQGGGRGFGYNRGGFRGRGFPIRPGMGQGFEHRPPPPGDMGRGAPWMGKDKKMIIQQLWLFSWLFNACYWICQSLNTSAYT